MEEAVFAIVASIILTGIIRTLGAIPEMPCPLFPVAAIIPAQAFPSLL